MFNFLNLCSVNFQVGNQAIRKVAVLRREAEIFS